MEIVVIEQTVREYRRPIPYTVYKAYVRYQLWCECDRNNRYSNVQLSHPNPERQGVKSILTESWYRTGNYRPIKVRRDLIQLTNVVMTR